MTSVGRRLHIDDIVVVEWTVTMATDASTARSASLNCATATAAKVTDYWGEPAATPEWRQSVTDRLDMPVDGIWKDEEQLDHH